MPNKDGTGPDGKGSRTGRGLGDCLDDKVKNDSNAKPKPKRENLGRGRGGRARGRGPCAYEIEERKNYKE